MSLQNAVFAADGSLQSQAAVGPELPLRTKTVRRLNQGDQQGRTDRTDRRNLAQQIRCAVLLALRQQIPSSLLADRLQRVELLVVELRPAAYAGFGDLGQPFVPMAGRVDSLARARNRQRSRKAGQMVSYGFICLVLHSLRNDRRITD